MNVDQAFATKYYDSLDSTIEEAKKQLATECRDERSGPYQDAIKRGLFMIGAVVAGFAVVVWGTRVAFRRIRSGFD